MSKRPPPPTARAVTPRATGRRPNRCAVSSEMKDALDPLLGRHEASFFGGKIDAGFMADAEFVAVIGEAIDAELHADGIEKNITGLDRKSTRLNSSHRT